MTGRPVDSLSSDSPLLKAPAAIICAMATLLLVLSSCGSSGPAPVTFDLTVPPGRTLSTPGRNQIAVADPTALQPLDTDRILVTSGATISYLGGAQWSDRLPRIVQARLIAVFENSGRAVARPGSSVNADYSLNLDLRSFGIAAGEQPESVVEISATLVALREGRIVGARVFKTSVPIAAVKISDAAPGLDEAATRTFADIVRWVKARV